jgi:lipoprotein NlpI
MDAATIPAPVLVLSFIALTAVAPPASRPQSPQALVELGESEFAAGRIEASIAAFDQLAALVPSAAPTLWQRGIALYVAGKYTECAAQFAAFHAEDPEDLENAAWHFLCVARARSLEQARTARLKAGPDPRVLRQQIDEMFGGQRTPEQLLDLAERSVALVQFYGHLYVGLYFDASGNRTAALEQLALAADSRYDAYGGFMNVVAKVYVNRLRTQ